MGLESRADAKKHDRKIIHPSFRVGMRAERRFLLSVESLDEAIGYGMVSGCPSSCASRKVVSW